MRLKHEQFEQIQLIKWFYNTFPELQDDIHHFANERKCSFKYGSLLKSMGVKRGVSDVFLAIPQNGKNGLWIELKVGKNKPTKSQIAFSERKKMRGYETSFCWGCEAAKVVLLDYLKDYISAREDIKQ